MRTSYVSPAPERDQDMTIPCYYINLDRSPERDASFRAECARVGIEPTPHRYS